MKHAKIFTSIMAALMLTATLTANVSATTNVDDKVGFIYVFQDMENETSVISKDAVKYEAEDYEDIAPSEPGSGMRSLPEEDYFMIWPDGTTEECDVTYEVSVDKDGTYEMIIVGTAVRASDSDSARGIAWWLEGGEKNQVDIQPIISRSYAYNNDPETGYAVGLVYGIKLDLKAGKNILHFGHHEDYGKSGRLNFDGFYIQPMAAEETVVAPDPVVVDEPIVTDAPATTSEEPAAPVVTAPVTADAAICLAAIASVCSVVAAVAKKRKAD